MSARKTVRRVLLIVVALIFAFSVLFPVYWILRSSFLPADKLFTQPIQYFSSAMTLENYRTLFRQLDIPSMAISTGIVTLFSLIITMIICVFAAYVFARFDNRLLILSFGFIVFSTMIPGVITIVPLYVFIRSLGLVDTYTGLVILYTSSLIPFTVTLLTGFIKQIPATIEEAAEVDGAGVFTVIGRILVPLLKPAIATLSIIIFILCMNEFFTPLIFTIRRITLLAVGIAQAQTMAVTQYTVPWDMISAMGMLIIAPLILFVAIFEKSIMTGLMAGSIRE